VAITALLWQKLQWWQGMAVLILTTSLSLSHPTSDSFRGVVEGRWALGCSIFRKS